MENELHKYSTEVNEREMLKKLMKEAIKILHLK